MFPVLDRQTISDVLSRCGNNASLAAELLLPLVPDPNDSTSNPHPHPHPHHDSTETHPNTSSTPKKIRRRDGFAILSIEVLEPPSPSPSSSSSPLFISISIPIATFHLSCVQSIRHIASFMSVADLASFSGVSHECKLLADTELCGVTVMKNAGTIRTWNDHRILQMIARFAKLTTLSLYIHTYIHTHTYTNTLTLTHTHTLINPRLSLDCCFLFEFTEASVAILRVLQCFQVYFAKTRIS